MQSLPERQPPLDRQRQLDRAQAGNMLVPNLAANTVSRIDPATNAVIDVLPVGSKPFPAANAFGDIWVPSAGGNDVYRLHLS